MRSLQRDSSCLSSAGPLDEMAEVWQAFPAARDLMAYQFRFYRMGGLDQVALESGDDLAHLHELDQKLWVALSCPVKGLELEERTLELLDLDKDGRVRVLWRAVQLCTVGTQRGSERGSCRRLRSDAGDPGESGRLVQP